MEEIESVREYHNPIVTEERMSIIKRRILVPEISLNEIILAVCEVYGVSYLSIKQDRWDERVYDARCMCIYLMFMKTTFSLRVLARAFLNIGYSDIIYSRVRAVKKLVNSEAHFSKLEKIIAITG